MSPASQTLESFYKECRDFAELIEQKQQEIIELVTTYETHATIQHEIRSSIDALHNVEAEFSSIAKPLSDITISAFFPLNLPLYSLVLYALIPSAFCKAIYVRPPEVMGELLEQLSELLEVGTTYFKPVTVKSIPRHVFLELYAYESDVILFTGKYENALAIHEACPHALLIYEGSGVGPLLVCDNADLDLAVSRGVAMRTFNSGQDCVAHDAFFVPTHLAKEFNTKLIAELEKLQVGDTKDPKTDIGRIIKDSYIKQIVAWLERESEHLIYGGLVDVKEQIVHPTVIYKNVKDHHGDFNEFFAPVFYVLAYDTEADLIEVLDSEFFTEHSMYASVFGSSPTLEAHMPKVKILRNTIVNDIEHGNEPYGGFGIKANFIALGQQISSKPVLISRDIHLAFSDVDPN